MAGRTVTVTMIRVPARLRCSIASVPPMAVGPGAHVAEALVRPARGSLRSGSKPRPSSSISQVEIVAVGRSERDRGTRRAAWRATLRGPRARCWSESAPGVGRVQGRRAARRGRTSRSIDGVQPELLGQGARAPSTEVAPVDQLRPQAEDEVRMSRDRRGGARRSRGRPARSASARLARLDQLGHVLERQADRVDATG